MTQPTISMDPAPTGVTVSRRGWLAALLTLVVFTGVVVIVSLQARTRWRAQVLQREGEVVGAVAAMQRDVLAQEAADIGLPIEDDPLLVAVQTSKLRGVLAFRLFDAAGVFVDALPAEVDEAALAADDLQTLAMRRSVVRFHPRFALGGLLLGRGVGETKPLLEVAVPVAAVDGGGLHAVIQYWIDGSLVEAEYARLDRELGTQAGAALLAGGALIAGLLTWAFRRLTRAQALLAARAHDLAAANRELAQAARTAAIGAITAHLMHGLRNPLAGLEGFVAAQGGATGDEAGDWASARESTRRLRTLIDETLGVLRDVQDGAGYDMSVREMCDGLCVRLRRMAAARQVSLDVEGAMDARLAARAAGVGGLALVNVVQNAVEASTAGGRVAVGFATTGGDAVLEVTIADSGPGLPVVMRADPFQPRRSTKPDGAGVGLALSRELARHAGGELELVRTGSDGSVFRLRLPLAVATASLPGAP